MQTRIVHVSPTPANRKLVEKLRKMPPLAEVEFRFLDEQKGERMMQLRQLGEGSVYIWGDGRSHHESLYLTDEGVRWKVNIDDHADDQNTSGITCASHMRHVNGNVRSMVVDSFIDRPLRNQRFFQMMERAIGMADPNSVHVTVDFDCLTAFPAAMSTWIIREGGMTMRQVAEAVAKTDGKLRMLDMGGLTEEIPDFEYVENGKPPSFMSTMNVVGFQHGGFEAVLRPEIVNPVLSYAVDAYYNVLVAVLFPETYLARR